MVILLAVVNVVLLLALILVTGDPPAAHAQVAPLGTNFVMVAGQIRRGVDALYVLDLSQRRLHVFVPNRDQANRRILHAGFRDLQRDFR
jgi:hypothetical protein